MTDQEPAEPADSGGNGSTTPITDSITFGIKKGAGGISWTVNKGAGGIRWTANKSAEGISWSVNKSAEGLNALIRHVNWCGIDGAVCSDTAGMLDWTQYYICGFYPLAEASVYPVYWWLSNPDKPPNNMHECQFGVLCFLLTVNCGAAAESSLRCILYILPNEVPAWLKSLKRRYLVVPCHAPVLISSMHFRASIFCLANFFWYYKYSSMYVTESKGAVITALVALAIHVLLTTLWCTENSRGTKEDLNEFLADDSIRLPTSRGALDPSIRI